MGTFERIVIVEVISEPSALILETNWFPGQPAQTHSVSVTEGELASFGGAFLSKPFGHSAHVVSLESISGGDSKFKCTVRVASEGSRQSQSFDISEETFSALQAVFDSNIISEGYVRA